MVPAPCRREKALTIKFFYADRYFFLRTIKKWGFMSSSSENISVHSAFASLVLRRSTNRSEQKNHWMIPQKKELKQANLKNI